MDLLWPRTSTQSFFVLASHSRSQLQAKLGLQDKQGVDSMTQHTTLRSAQQVLVGGLLTHVLTCEVWPCTEGMLGAGKVLNEILHLV